MNSISDYYRLEREQKEIYDILRERDTEIADYYKGGIIAIKLEHNPENLIHAAHSFRELLEKLPKIVDVPFDVTSERNQFQSHVEKTLENWTKFQDGEFSEDQECEKAKNFLQELCTIRSQLNTRKDEFRSFMENHEDRKRVVHDDVLNNFFRQKKDLYGYFAGISHHSEICIQKEFLEKLENLEQFLSVIFEPPTSSQIEEINDLLGI